MGCVTGHLTNDEIMSYVKTDTVCEESVALSERVTKHITGCWECLSRLRRQMALCEVLDVLTGLRDCSARDFAFEVSRESVEAEAAAMVRERAESGRIGE